MNKKLEDMDFNEMVDALAGDALLQLVRGEKWRGIFFTVVSGALQWKAAQPNETKR